MVNACSQLGMCVCVKIAATRKHQFYIFLATIAWSPFLFSFSIYIFNIAREDRMRDSYGQFRKLPGCSEGECYASDKSHETNENTAE